MLDSAAAIIESNVEFVLFLIFAFSVLLALVEAVWELGKGKFNRAYLAEIATNFFTAVPNAIAEGAATTAGFAIYYALYKWAPLKLPSTWWTFGLALLAADFIHYWTHRWEHEVRVLWAHHSVHHSSPVFNYSTAYRVVFTRVVFDMVYYLPLVLIGFHPLIVLACLSTIGIYQTWLHTQLIGKLGWFEKVFCTPSHHRAHHGSDDKYLDKNYGAILIIWDKMFGTFQAEEETPTYGLTTPIASSHPMVVHFYEYARLYRDLKSADSFSHALRIMFSSPGVLPQEVSRR